MSTYCTKHGLVHMTQRGCNRCNPLPHRIYANIVLVSNTQMRRSPLGEPMPGIGEVISEHLVVQPEFVEMRRLTLENEHKAVSYITL